MLEYQDQETILFTQITPRDIHSILFLLLSPEDYCKVQKIEQMTVPVNLYSWKCIRTWVFQVILLKCILQYVFSLIEMRWFCGLCWQETLTVITFRSGRITSTGENTELQWLVGKLGINWKVLWKSPYFM